MDCVEEYVDGPTPVYFQEPDPSTGLGSFSEVGRLSKLEKLAYSDPQLHEYVLESFPQ